MPQWMWSQWSARAKPRGSSGPSESQQGLSLRPASASSIGQSQNSSITSSSIASDGRHSTRPRAARSAVWVEQPDRSRSRESRPELGGGHELGAVDQGAGGRRDGDPLWTVMSSGCSGGTPVDYDAGERGVEARVVRGSGNGHVNRLVVVAVVREVEDCRAFRFVDRFDIAACEVDVDREPVIPGDLELVTSRVVEGGGEARQPRLLEHLGEMPFGLVWIDRCWMVFHASHRRRGARFAPAWARQQA